MSVAAKPGFGGHRRVGGMRRDPGEHGENPLFFGFARGQVQAAERTLAGGEWPELARLPTRRGAAEREIRVAHAPASVQPPLVRISTHGWYVEQMTLDPRQARFLRDQLSAWLESL